MKTADLIGPVDEWRKALNSQPFVEIVLEEDYSIEDLGIINRYLRRGWGLKIIKEYDRTIIVSVYE